MELTYKTLKNELKTVTLPCTANLSSLDKFYEDKGQPLHEDYIAFKELWKSKLERELFHPRAVAKRLTPREIADFGFDMSSEILGHAEKVYAFTWTLGGELGHRVEQLASEKKLTESLLLGVAGSVALRNIRQDIIRWLTSHSRGAARFVCAEHYPGLEVFPLKFVPRVLEITGALSIGVSANKANFLFPATTKCAFFFLGKEARPTRPIRCTPCFYEKCSYWQMGGCHMLFLDDSPTH